MARTLPKDTVFVNLTLLCWLSAIHWHFFGVFLPFIANDRIEYYPLSVFIVLSLLGFQTYYRSKKNIFSWIYLINSYNRWLVLYLFFSKGKYEFFKWMTDVYTSFSMMLSDTGRRLSLRIITGSTSGDYVILPAHQSILGFLEVLWFVMLFFF